MSIYHNIKPLHAALVKKPYRHKQGHLITTATPQIQQPFSLINHFDFITHSIYLCSQYELISACNSIDNHKDNEQTCHFDATKNNTVN